MQMIKLFNEIFKKAQISLKIHPYEILITSSSSGLLEFLSNTSSIDGIKKAMVTNSKNLNLFYRKYFNDDFEEAQKNFVESLAAYSLICYYLQIKDRHNGNILIDKYGNIIHIDFGFILGISPGNLNFESAPFKLTKEYIEIMDGENSEMFLYYKNLMIKGMIEAKKHVETFVKIVEIMSHGSKMPCFDKKDINIVIQKLRERFYEKESDRNFPKIVDELVYKSNDNFWTNKYDYFQKVTNGILP
jgi:phosphatidylinositol 4-kinase